MSGPAAPSPFDRRLGLALAASFLPFAWKASVYARLGAWTAPTTFAVLFLVAGIGWARGGPASRRGVRTWAVAMVLWGAARLVLAVLVPATGLREAHLRSQLDGGWVLVSLLYLAGGIWLWRAVGRRGRASAAL